MHMTDEPSDRKIEMADKKQKKKTSVEQKKAYTPCLHRTQQLSCCDAVFIFLYFINPSMEYLIPIWWPSVSKIVQKHRRTRFSHCRCHCKTVSNCLFVRGSNSN